MKCNDNIADSLIGHCKELLEIANRIDDISYNDNDHFGFMSLCFLSKQTNHMNAILKLYPHPDIKLISRTMIEGLIQLLWCFNNPEKAFQWRAFSWVCDWRLFQSKLKDGESVQNDQLEAIENSLKVHGYIFKKKKSKSNEDPYHQNWRCGITLKKISADVEGDSLYDMIYSPFSDWQHWGVKSIGMMLKRMENNINYNASNFKDQLCGSIAVAYQCLYQILELVNKHHDLGISEQLNNINKKYFEYSAVK